jgi:DNA polymerase III alpha subunit
MLSGNILEILDVHPCAAGAVAARDLARHAGRSVKVFGWPIARRVHCAGDDERPMMFLTLEDKTECIDVIVWPAVYDRCYDALQESGPFEIWGKVTEDFDTYSLEARTIRPADWSPALVDLQRASERLARPFTNANSYQEIVRANAA